MGPGSLLFFLRPKSVPPFFSVAVCWYGSMNPSWSVGCPAHAYETPSRSLPLYHEEGGEEEEEEERRYADSSVKKPDIFFLLVLSCFPSCFCRGTRLLEVIIGRLSSRKSSIKQKTCHGFHYRLRKSRNTCSSHLIIRASSLEPKIRFLLG